MLSRRIFIAGIGGGALSVPGMAYANPTRGTGHGRTLQLRHMHTGERLLLTLGRNQRPTMAMGKQLNHFLRDHHNGVVGKMDPDLIQHLLTVQDMLELKDPVFDIFSAYRSARTNAKLRRASRQVAKRSMHLEGKAIDFRVRGAALKEIRDAALDLKIGGVGYYRRSGFVHLDTGRVRWW